MRQAEEATARGDFLRRATIHIDFHRILARMSGNPVMVVMMDGLLTVLRHFVESLGEYDNAFVLPSRRRFLKLMEARDAAGAVAEMESSLKKVQREYLAHARVVAGAAAAGSPRPSRASGSPA